MLCKNPVKIYNKYIGRYMFVKCGKCSSCRLSHSNKYISLLMSEFTLNSKNYENFFVTLTYSPDCVPTYLLGEDGVFHCENRKKNPLTDVKTLIKTKIPNNSIYSKETHHFATLHKPDVQNYIHSLNDIICNVFKNSSQKIPRLRYFVRGEYGTRFRRPHYHIIFRVPSTCDFINLQTFQKKWHFGAVDVKKIDSANFIEAASYISGYLNTPYVSEIFNKFKETKEFITCSRKPFLGSIAPNSDIYEKILFDSLVTRPVYNYQQKASFPQLLPRYIFDAVFRKCKSFTRLSYKELLHIYCYTFDGYTWKKPSRILDVDYPESWTYADKKASLTCAQICWKYNITPQIYLVLLFKHELKKLLFHLQNQKENEYGDHYLTTYTKFFDELPLYAEELSEYQLFALEDAKLLEKIYPCGLLDSEFISKFEYSNTYGYALSKQISDAKCVEKHLINRITTPF